MGKLTIVVKKMVRVSQHCPDKVATLLRGKVVILHQGLGLLVQVSTQRVAEGLHLLLSKGDQGIEKVQGPVNGLPNLMGGGSIHGDSAKTNLAESGEEIIKGNKVLLTQTRGSNPSLALIDMVRPDRSLLCIIPLVKRRMKQRECYLR